MFVGHHSVTDLDVCAKKGGKTPAGLSVVHPAGCHPQRAQTGVLGLVCQAGLLV